MVINFNNNPIWQSHTNTFKVAGSPDNENKKAEGNVIHYNAGDSSAMNTASQAAVAQARNRRFDTFVNDASQNFIEKLNSKSYGSLKHIMLSSAEDRRYFAYMYKENMKSLVNDAIAHEEAELEKFKDLKEQKAYYQNIIAKDGYVKEGKYEYAGISKRYVSVKEAEEYLENVQGKINDLVTAKAAKESDPFNTKTYDYIYSGTAFLAAADMKGNLATEVDDVSVSGQWTRTEENYIDSANASISSLKQRLKDIDKMYRAFMEDDGFEQRISEQVFDGKKLKFLMQRFDQWNKKALLKYEEMGYFNENEVMETFDKILGL